MDGLDVRAADHLGGAVGALTADGAEVGDEPVHGIGSDGDPLRLEGLFEGLAGGVGVEQVEAEPAGEAAGDAVEVGLERGDVLLAHGEQRPEARVLQHGPPELIEELLLRGMVGGIGREDLLELVEDQDQPRRAGVRLPGGGRRPSAATRAPVHSRSPGGVGRSLGGLGPADFQRRRACRGGSGSTAPPVTPASPEGVGCLTRMIGRS